MSGTDVQKQINFRDIHQIPFPKKEYEWKNEFVQNGLSRAVKLQKLVI